MAPTRGLAVVGRTMVQSSPLAATSFSACRFEAPYFDSCGSRAASEETNTKRGTRAATAASTSAMVPSTLPRWKPIGSGVLTTPATWITASALATSRVSAFRS